MSPSEHMVLALVADGTLVVNDLGQIWRTATRTRLGRQRPMEPQRADHLKSDGYRCVRASVCGRGYSALAHRIVWLVRCGDIPDGLEINHRDGVRGNNCPSNLELVTKGENLAHSYRVLGRVRPSGERNPQGRLKASQVAEIRELHAAGESLRALGRRFGVTHRSIRLIVTGMSWHDEYPDGAQ